MAGMVPSWKPIFDFYSRTLLVGLSEICCGASKQLVDLQLYKSCQFHNQYGSMGAFLKILRRTDCWIWCEASGKVVDFKVWETDLFIVTQVSDLWPIGPLVFNVLGRSDLFGTILIVILCTFLICNLN